MLKAQRIIFEKANILDTEALDALFSKYQPDGVIHLAAESHVDRSILSPLDFVYTNIIGTVNLLNTAKSTGRMFRAGVLSCFDRRSFRRAGRHRILHRGDPV